jgi:hypothetical protein
LLPLRHLNLLCFCVDTFCLLLLTCDFFSSMFQLKCQFSKEACSTYLSLHS